MGKLKDWLMRKYGDLQEPESGPSDDAYYAADPTFSSTDHSPVITSMEELLRSLNTPDHHDQSVSKEVF